MSSPHKRPLVVLPNQKDDWAEPPSKKQKINEQQNSNSKSDKMELDIDEIEETKTQNNALILFADSMSNAKIDSFCGNLTNKHKFKIIQRKRIELKDETKREYLENIFLDCSCSTMDICDIIRIGMFEEFIASKSILVIELSQETDTFYRKLNISTLSHTKELLNRMYITLNYFDYLFKYELLFGDSDTKNERKPLLFYHSNNCIQTANEANEMEIRSIQTKNEFNATNCCCIPITMYLNHSEMYGKYVHKYGINAIAKQYYFKSIAMNTSFDSKTIDIILNCLGNVIHDEINKYQTEMVSYQCKHCNATKCMNSNFKSQLMVLNSLYLEQQKMLQKHALDIQMNNEKHSKKQKIQNTNQKVKKKKDENNRLCEVCNVEVPSSEKNWNQHINGKKHKKKLKLKEQKS